MKARLDLTRRNLSSVLFSRSLLIVALASALFGQDRDQAPANLAISVQGRVEVKHHGWSNFAPVVFGTSLYVGDLLRLEKNATITIACSDLKVQQITSAEAGIPCPVSRSLLRRPDGSLITATREWPSDREFPLVLSPRKTKLLSGRPLLRWTAVEGARVYDVSIRGVGTIWTARVTSVTEIPYPTGAPALKSGIEYKLVVSSGGHSSSAEPGADLGFSVLDSKAQKDVRKQRQRIDQLGVPDEAAKLLIGYLYSAHELKAEAISDLTNLCSDFKEPAVCRLLADLYIEVGVVRQAESFYLAAIDLAGKKNDQEDEMFAHFGLANIYVNAFDNKSAGREQLKLTLTLAKQLGDSKTIMVTEKKLADVEMSANK